MSEKVLITKSNMESIADAIRYMNGGATEYLPSEMPAAIRSIQPVLQEKTFTENGDYTPDTGYDGFGVVHVAVQGGGGGGEGPIYYGTSAPASSIGSNEDLYIQYEVISGSDHTYRIVKEYRKVNGVWTQYTIPEMATKGVHIWTASIDGFNAAMFVQAGFWDTYNNAFVATGEVEKVVYTAVRSWDTAKNCNDVALLAYPSGWQIKASATITDGTNTYQLDDIVSSWSYNQEKDIYIWKPAT